MTAIRYFTGVVERAPQPAGTRQARAVVTNRNERNMERFPLESTEMREDVA
jgi:hypothetical protein